MRLDLLSRNIKAARSASGLTQEDVAFRAAMQPAVYSRIERGAVTPQLKSLSRIAGALETSLTELLRGVC